MAGQKLRMKPHVVPHLSLFTPRKRRREIQLTDSSKKRKKLFMDSLKSIPQVTTSPPMHLDSTQAVDPVDSRTPSLREHDFIITADGDDDKCLVQPLPAPRVGTIQQTVLSPRMKMKQKSRRKQLLIELSVPEDFPKPVDDYECLAEPLPSLRVDMVKKNRRKRLLNETATPTPDDNPTRTNDDECLAEPISGSRVDVGHNNRRKRVLSETATPTAVDNPTATNDALTDQKTLDPLLRLKRRKELPNPNCCTASKNDDKHFALPSSLPARGAARKLQGPRELEAPRTSFPVSATQRLRDESPMSTNSLGSSSFGDTASDYSISTLTSQESVDGLFHDEVGWDRQMRLMKRDSRFYLGIPPEEFRVINLISKHSTLITRDILITIKKIRLNDSNKRLADDFNLSVGHVSKIFVSTVTILSAFFSKLVFWPPSITNKLLMPISFRHRFMNVESIIDCFEIEIQKPQSPKYQALTWSAYKKCNTIKVLISANPFGFINFISEAYGGRISDRTIVQESGFLDVVPQGSAVLADRGFKQLEGTLQSKDVKLIRPASVSANFKPTKIQIRESKRIAATRIHIERVISRIREFHFLGPHSRINMNHVRLVDHCIVIAAGIINLQEPIIKVRTPQLRAQRKMT